MKRVLGAREMGAAILLILLFMVTSLREPRFLQAQSLSGILLFLPILAVIGIGEMTVIVTRGIDISVGSTVGVSAMVVGMLFRAHPSLALSLGLAAGVGTGLVLGCVNGALIALARVPPIIATLGTLSAYRGLVFIISHGEQVDANFIPDRLIRWSSEGPIHIGGYIHGFEARYEDAVRWSSKGPTHIGELTITWLLLIALFVSLLFAVGLARTRTGRDIFAYGSNPKAARLRGIPVRRIVFLVYALTGACAGLAGVLYISQFGSVNASDAGKDLELKVIAAVAIGGTNIAGGSGSVLGVLLGCLLLCSVDQARAVLAINENWQQLAYGAIILIAVLINGFVRRAGQNQGVRR